MSPNLAPNKFLAHLECKKTFQRQGIRPPDLAGELQHSPRPPSWWKGQRVGWLPLLNNPTPAPGHLGLGLWSFGPRQHDELDPPM